MTCHLEDTHWETLFKWFTDYKCYARSVLGLSMRQLPSFTVYISTDNVVQKGYFLLQCIC